MFRYLVIAYTAFAGWLSQLLAQNPVVLIENPVPQAIGKGDIQSRSGAICSAAPKCRLCSAGVY